MLCLINFRKGPVVKSARKLDETLSSRNFFIALCGAHFQARRTVGKIYLPKR